MASFSIPLGEAVAPRQLLLMTTSFVFFTSIYQYTVSLPITKRDASGQWVLVSPEERCRFGDSMCGTVHALLSCALSAFTLLQPDVTPSTLYSRSTPIQTLNAMSAGFFLWDVRTVLKHWKQIGPAEAPPYLFHGISCFASYFFAQYPFAYKYSPKFLLFELSTPLLHARHYFVYTNQKDHPRFNLVQTLFGLTFFLVRIVLGWPLTLQFFSELIPLIRSGRIHSRFVGIFCIISTSLLALLNGFWFYKMVKRKLKMDKQKQGKQ